jgi:hypothetical protein
VEQHIMNLNGWVNKTSNTANRVLSNKNAAAVKDIYLKEGLKWLEKNVPEWQSLFKVL